jgi:hypothetical protein
MDECHIFARMNVIDLRPGSASLSDSGWQMADG